MTTYLLRDIPTDLWRRAKSRAALEGQSLRVVLLDLLTAYAAKRPTVTVTDDAILTLRAEAGAAGDLQQVALCDRALGRAPLPGVTRAEARAQCAAAIADAAAQRDDG